MLPRIIAALAAFVITPAAHAGDFAFAKGPMDVRWYLAEGAVVCPLPSSLDEAHKAAARRDTPWLISTGCSQAFGRPEAIFINSMGAYWQVRAQWSPDSGETLYVSIYDLITRQNGKEIGYRDLIYPKQDLTKVQRELDKTIAAGHVDLGPELEASLARSLADYNRPTKP